MNIFYMLGHIVRIGSLYWKKFPKGIRLNRLTDANSLLYMMHMMFRIDMWDKVVDMLHIVLQMRRNQRDNLWHSFRLRGPKCLYN